MSDRDRGNLHVYADVDSRRLLGAKVCIPGIEHIAHLLAWSIQKHLALSDVLEIPYYHPTHEEGLRTAVAQPATCSEKRNLMRCPRAETSCPSGDWTDDFHTMRPY